MQLPRQRNDKTGNAWRPSVAPGGGAIAWAIFTLLILSACVGEAPATLRQQEGAIPAEEPATSAAAVAAEKPNNDISPLFAAPSQAEIAAVIADWESRNPVAADWRLEAESDLDGRQTWIVSHEVDGNRHYGAVRFPAGFERGRSYPVLVINHGGEGGFNLEVTLGNFDVTAVADGCTADAFIYVLPSYRSEAINSASMGLFESGGEPSVMDRDVDDAIALLDGVLANVPEADPNRVAVWGESRGGGVTLLMSERDERVNRAVVLYPLVDFMMPYYERVLQTMLNAGATNLSHPLLPLVLEYVRGEATAEEIRFALLKHSPAYFVDRLPALQVHHGRDDNVVPIAHSDRLDEMMRAAGSEAAEFEYFTYEGGSHQASTLAGSSERAGEFLCELVQSGAESK